MSIFHHDKNYDNLHFYKKYEVKDSLKIAYIGSPELFQRGASAIHVMKMCQAMARLGMDVELILPSYREKIDIFEHYNVEPNFKLIPLPSFRNSFARHIVHGAAGAVYTRLKRKNFDLAVTRNIFYTYLSTRLLKIPTVYDAHHPLVNGIARSLFDSFKNSEHLARFSTNSHGLAAMYIKLGLPQDKLAVAPNGVDLKGFREVPSKEESRRLVGLPAGRKIVCYSGNSYSGRGIELLIEVALRLKDALFLVVGGLENDIQRYISTAQVRNAGNFVFAGFVPQKSVGLYLSSADVLVMPYTSRMTIKGGTNAADFTSPIKLFEYMASRRPIVATTLPSIREILEDGVNALLVEPDSVDSFYHGVRKVLDNQTLAERLSAQAGNDVTKYTWEERVKKILNGLYDL